MIQNDAILFTPDLLCVSTSFIINYGSSSSEREKRFKKSFEFNGMCNVLPIIPLSDPLAVLTPPVMLEAIQIMPFNAVASVAKQIFTVNPFPSSLISVISLVERFIIYLKNINTRAHRKPIGKLSIFYVFLSRHSSQRSHSSSDELNDEQSKQKSYTCGNWEIPLFVKRNLNQIRRQFSCFSWWKFSRLYLKIEIFCSRLNNDASSA